MQRLTASDCIDPAWRHTWSLLAAPRQWRTLLKVGTVAVLANLGGSNSSFTSPGTGGSLPRLSHAVVVLLLVLAGAVALAVGLLLFYISSRLRFVLFDMILRRETVIGPLWRRYAAQTWRWIGLKLGAVLLILACTAPLAIPAILHLVRLAKTGGTASQAELTGELGTFVLYFLCLFCLILVFVMLFTLLSDFAVPVLALSGCRALEALRTVVSLVRAEPARFAGYLLVRLLIGFVCGLVGALGVAAAIAVLALPLGAAGYGLWSGLHGGGPMAHVLLIAGISVLALALLIPLVLLYLMVFGYLLCFLQAYTLYFLGGRYPAVGSILDLRSGPWPDPPPSPGWLPVPPPPHPGYTG